MIVADTSALISIATVDLIDTVLSEFEVHTTEIVVRELEDTAEYDDVHAEAARVVLDHEDRIRTHETGVQLETSRIDEGEGSVVELANELEADFLITDDLRALPELKAVADSRVAISPIVLKALVKRGVLPPENAREMLDRLAERRDWLGAPIYRRAKSLFDI